MPPKEKRHHPGARPILEELDRLAQEHPGGRRAVGEALGVAIYDLVEPRQHLTISVLLEALGILGVDPADFFGRVYGLVRPSQQGSSGPSGSRRLEVKRRVRETKDRDLGREVDSLKSRLESLEEAFQKAKQSGIETTR